MENHTSYAVLCSGDHRHSCVVFIHCSDTMSNLGNEMKESRDHSNRLVRAKTYRHGWNNDLLALSKFVKEQIFYVVVHDFKNESDDPLDVNHGAICQNLYLKKFPTKVTKGQVKKR